MSVKFNARELAFHYLARQSEKLSEVDYLEKLVEVEAIFTALLASANPPVMKNALDVWDELGKKP